MLDTKERREQYEYKYIEKLKNMQKAILNSGGREKVDYKSGISVTEQMLREIGWKNVTSDTTNELNYWMRKYDINTPERVACFLANATHETNFNREIDEGPNNTYLKSELENGKYRGAGYLHLTQKDNYIGFSNAVRDPLVAELGASYVLYTYPWESACWYWVQNGCNKAADGENPWYDTASIVRYGNASHNNRVTDNRTSRYTQTVDVLKKYGVYS